MPFAKDNLVLLGVFSSAHGLRGLLKVKTFTDDPGDIASYGPLLDTKNNTSYILSVITVLKNNFVIAKVQGIETRTQADELRNIRLFCKTASLPLLTEDEYYKSSLIGLKVELLDGAPFGTVSEVFNFGSGDILEIKTQEGKKKLFPFTRDAFPLIDIASGIISLSPPETIGAI